MKSDQSGLRLETPLRTSRFYTRPAGDGLEFLHLLLGTHATSISGVMIEGEPVDRNSRYSQVSELLLGPDDRDSEYEARLWKWSLKFGHLYGVQTAKLILRHDPHLFNSGIPEIGLLGRPHDTNPVDRQAFH